MQPPMRKACVVRRAPQYFSKISQNVFAVAEAIEERRNRADVERVRAQPYLVAGDAAQLGQDHADVLRARRRFHVQQLLDRLAVAQPVGDRGDVIHAVDIGIEHRVGAVLANFFHATMQVADDALGAQDLLAVELQDDAQHAVRGRMLRSHVEDEFGGVKKSFVLGIEVEIVGAFAHCPLSMPRLIFTHSWSCCRMA